MHVAAFRRVFGLGQAPGEIKSRSRSLTLTGRASMCAPRQRCPGAVHMCSGSEAGSYWRLIDSCITELKVQGPSRTCDECEERRHIATFGRVFGGQAPCEIRSRSRSLILKGRAAHPPMTLGIGLR